MAGELIDCLMFIEDPWWVWFSMNMNTSVGFFLNQKHGTSRCRNLKDFPNYSTWSPSFRMHVNNKLRKCSFIGSFLSFTYWPQIRLSPEFNLWPGGWLPFAISQVVGANLSLTSATTIGIFQSKRLLESRGVLPFLPPAGTKKPGLGNPGGWSVLPKWLPGRIALLWARWFH